MEMKRYTLEEYELKKLREDNEKMLKILALVRDELSFMIDKDNECGGMEDCFTSNYECIECLVKNISNKYKNK